MPERRRVGVEVGVIMFHMLVGTICVTGSDSFDSVGTNYVFTKFCSFCYKKVDFSY